MINWFGKKGLKAIFFLSFHDFTCYAYTRVCMQPCMCTRVSRWQNLCGGHRAIYRSWFPLSTVWVAGIKLEFSWLAASPFTLWAISPVWEKYFSSISIQHLFTARSYCGNHSIENPGYPSPPPPLSSASLWAWTGTGPKICKGQCSFSYWPLLT